MCPHLGCHGARYVRYARGWYAYPVRTVRGALGAGRPAPSVRTQRGRLVRVARTYPTEAPGRASQLRSARSAAARTSSSSLASSHRCTCATAVGGGALSTAKRAPARCVVTGPPVTAHHHRVRVRVRVRDRVRVRVRVRVGLGLGLGLACCIGARATLCGHADYTRTCAILHEKSCSATWPSTANCATRIARLRPRPGK